MTGPASRWETVRDSDDKGRAYRDWLRDERAMAELAASPDQEAIIDEVAEVLSRARADRLRRRLRDAPPLRIVDDHEAPRMWSTAELHDDAPDVVVPSGYRVSLQGVERITDEGYQLIARRPMLLHRTLLDVDTGIAHVEVGWLSAAGTWDTAIVPRSTIASSRALLTLADRGAPVAQTTAHACVGWLAEQEHALPRGAAALTTARCGWHRGSYQWGRTTIGDLDLSIIPEPAVEPIADGCTTSGTYEAWCGAVAELEELPAVWLGLYAACASCLMDPCGVDVGAVVSLVGPRARGKTSILRLAASVWGRPTEAGGIIRSWDSTAYGIEQAAALSSGMVLILDETSRVRRSVDVASMIYALANGAGSQRGTERARSWRLIVLSTGEQPLSAYGGMEGAASRTIEVVESHYMPDATTAQLVEAAAMDHYGHLGPRIVRLMQAREWASVRAWYRERRDALQAERPRLTRAARTVALLEAAAHLAHAAGCPRPTCDVWAWLWSQLERHATETDQAAQGWALFESRLAAEREIGRWAKGTPVTVEQVRAWLDDAGLPARSIMREWTERRWVVTERGGRFRRAYVGGSQVACVIPSTMSPNVTESDTDGAAD